MKGRPTKYKKEFIVDTDKYFKNCINKGQMPYIEDIAMLLGVDETTIWRWSEAKSDFCNAISKIKLLQKLQLKRLVAKSPSGAIFLLKANHGLIEAEKVLHGGTPEEEQITLVISRAPE